MYTLDKVEEFANKHIESIIGKENVTPDCIEMLGELVDIVKDVSEYRKNNSTTYAMDSYSPEKTMEYTYRYGDNMGNYGRRMPYNNMYGDDHQFMQKLEHMYAEAQTEQERQTIKSLMDKMR